MADYNQYDFQRATFDDRFAPVGWVIGRDIWQRGIEAFLFGGERLRADEWVNDIRRARLAQPAACPRVFISHRQVDETWARRIAWLAWSCNFDYWLDVIDLDSARNRQVELLEGRLGRLLLDFEKGILTAAIIEMALLNCTHVLAVMTGNTAGSQWVAYEYGRVKAPPPLSIESSCWWDATTLPGVSFPEYMYLGPIHFTQAAITAWLIAEQARYPSCPGTPRDAQPERSVCLPTG